MASSTEYAG